MTASVVRRQPVTAVAATLLAAFTWLVAAPTGSGATPAPAKAVAAVVDPALAAAHGTVDVIVTGASSVKSSVRRMGGDITRDLPLIGGFSARVPAADIPRIAQLPGAGAITLDRPTYVQAKVKGGGGGSGAVAPATVYKKVVRGDALTTAGARGKGVTIALIDTGVTALPDVAGSLVQVPADALGLIRQPCVNLTSETTCNDSYGHGTFMAGLMVGSGASSKGTYVGMAPAAKLISVKIAGASGASDVSTIIAALQWVVANKSTYNIRVVNLSLGTDSTQTYHVDPLDYAVEKAWQAGIVVNVAASNRGPAASTISDPANDPFVITVGAIDDKGTVPTGDDVLPNFSGRGPTATDNLAKPDVVAPGAHLVSLAAPGATITTNFPSTMAAPYRRGSGTSMANAVVTGLVAQLISSKPNVTPDRVKYELMATAHRTASTDPLAVGAGLVDGWAALSAPAGNANVGVEPSLGTGSLAASRGTVGIVLDDANHTVLDASSGDATALVNDLTPALDGSSWWGSSWWGSSWWGSSWWGSSWWGSSWWGASMNGVSSSSENYGSSWWGGAWYGAWDQ